MASDCTGHLANDYPAEQLAWAHSVFVCAPGCPITARIDGGRRG